MKKFLVILIMLIPLSLFGRVSLPGDGLHLLNETPTITNNIQIYQEVGEETVLLGRMSLEQWGYLIEGARRYKDEIEAEMSGRVKVILKKDKHWKVTLNKPFETDIEIRWLKPNGKVFKVMGVKVNLTITKDGIEISDVREIYRNVAEVGFPISLGILIYFLWLLL